MPTVQNKFGRSTLMDQNVFNSMRFIFTGRNEVLAKVIFLQACVILSTGGRYLTRPPPQTRQVHPPRPGRSTPQAGTPPGQVHTPPGRYTPRAGTPPWAGTPPRQVHPLGRYTPPGRYTLPPGGTPPLGWYTPLAGTSPLGQVQPPPPGTADSVIRSTFGRYASYWNAFLFVIKTQYRVDAPI